MNNPLEIEQKFEKLQKQLALSGSVRERLFLIHDFLAGYQKNRLLYESYVHQLAEQIPVIEHPMQLAGTDPGLLIPVYETFQNVQADYPVLSELDSFRNALRSVRDHIIFLFACLGEYQTASEWFISENQTEVYAAGEESDVSDWILWMGEHYPGRHLEIARLQKMWEQSQKSDKHSIYIPVVERKAGDDLLEKQWPRLRKLSVDLDQNHEKEDNIKLDAFTFGAEQHTAALLSTSLSAARALLKKKAPKADSLPYKGHVSFWMSHAFHTGSSANLGIAGLLYTSMLEASNERVRLYPEKNVAVTGDISETGEVVPVDGSTLPLKVRACFFSWIDLLVVPKSQLDIAVKSSEKLQESYPDKKLTILGVSHLEELFFDRRISREVRVSRVRRAGQMAWRKKTELVSGILVLMMAGFMVFLVSKPLDNNPAMVEYKGETMFIKNREDQVLWKTKEWQQTPIWSAGISPLKLAEFYDVNRDGINDIIQLEYESSKAGENYLTCYDGLTHKVLWRLSKKIDLHFPHKPFIGNDSYHSYGMLLDTVSSGPPSLYMIENHTKYFPGILLRIDPFTGLIKNTFVNTGQLYGMGLLDINHDGKKEVIVTGVNNSYNEAVIAVLPHDHFFGRSPSDSMYILPQKSLDSRLGYIRIPMTYLGKSLQNIATYNAGRKIELNETGLLVLENDARLGIADSLTSNAMVLLQFNKTMHLTSIGTNDAYDLLSRLLKKRGKIKKMPPPGYFVHFKDSLLYWNGKGWQHKAYLPFWSEDSVGGVVDSSR